MIKVLSVFGTRPEAIKMAPVLRQLAQHPDLFVSRVCVTAQHRQMLDQIVQLFEITPDYDLNLMRPNQTLAKLTTEIIDGLSAILEQEKPDWLLVQGDTTTVFAAALAAFYHGVKIGHVEAGLRTWDKRQPFPEEANRRLTSVLADLHFAPTESARANLIKENVAPETIVVTGNTVIDALYWASSLPYDDRAGDLTCIPQDKRIVLVTAHRRENFGEPLKNICRAIRQLAHEYADTLHFVYPVHLNPNVQTVAYDFLAGIPNISLLGPLDYLPLIQVMKAAFLVLTDSGGIQEEAPGLGKPVLVLRNTTERPEAVTAGTVKLVGTDEAAIVAAVRLLVEDEHEYLRMAKAANPYGDGYAAQRIVEHLARQ